MTADRSAAAVDVSRRVHAVGRVALPLFRRVITHPPLSCSPDQPDAAYRSVRSHTQTPPCPGNLTSMQYIAAEGKIGEPRSPTPAPAPPGRSRVGHADLGTVGEINDRVRPLGELPVNSRREPRDPVAYRRDRRQAVLRHHPDKGGDPDALLRALEEVDRRHGVVGAGRGDHGASAEQVAAVAVTAFAGVAAVGLSVAMSILGRRR